MKLNFKAAIALTALTVLCSMTNANASDRQLRIYSWVEYIPQQVLDDFRKKTGITVNYDVYDSSQTLEAKLLTGSSGYDVATVSNGQLGRMITAGAFQPLDRQKLPNWSHLDPVTMTKLATSDKNNEHAVPYLWGTTLIGYNVDKVKQALGADVQMNDWGVIFKPENMKKLSTCGVAILDAPEEFFPIALNYLGLQPNSQSRDDYKKAEDLLLSIRPYVRYFDSSKSSADLATGDICVAVAWSGAITGAIASVKAAGTDQTIKLAMTIPRQGTIEWSDNFIIPKGANNVNDAHEFINYMMDPEVIAQCSNSIGYPNANKDALDKVAPEIRNNPSIYIPDEMRSKLFVQVPAPNAIERLRTRAWTNIKSGT
ncbi:spermidine/putrescine ABC transporter substrate-binding protein PotF [Pseudomonas frederiksbergensis]|uniref:Spermidine/putrescine ABC transporter substrate-binding protein PotF n=1 Tax=Pseudomonas frederiksbergensis TaxID=104087 RepID=A0A1J0ER40_9PSED|nr:polyamine ABC transporter substrate-binding protein [Pseudomonas frederiksbergensis]APC18629.1 spermidine/putrescine ABC transporter substrate-binding protein PotF [Pseudomonas frederiksbergensis]